MSYEQDQLMLDKIAAFDGDSNDVIDLLLLEFTRNTALNRYISPRLIAVRLVALYESLVKDVNDG